MHRDEVRHNLRTPLTVVKGVLRLLELVQDDQLPKDVRAELIDRANGQVRKLEAAIEAVESQFSDNAEYDVAVLHEEIVRI